MFPASGKVMLNGAWLQMIQTAAQIKSTAQSLVSAPSVSRMQALNYANSLAAALATLDSLAGTSGIAEYAQAQMNDATINIVTEYTAMRFQIVATQNWIVANFPNDGAGNLIVYTFDANKRYVDIALTTAERSAFVAVLNSLIATIN